MQKDVPDMLTPSGPHETQVCSGPANAQRGMETVGGWLYLTSERLIFEAHGFNIQRGRTTISLRQVSGLERCWTCLLGIVPLAPSSILVRTLAGDAHRFVVCGREAWLADIGDQIAAQNTRPSEGEGMGRALPRAST